MWRCQVETTCRHKSSDTQTASGPTGQPCLQQPESSTEALICGYHMVVLKIGEAQHTNINILNDSALIDEPSLWELALHRLTDVKCTNGPTCAIRIAKCDSTTCDLESLQGSEDFRPHRWTHCWFSAKMYLPFSHRSVTYGSSKMPKSILCIDLELN